MKSYQFQVGSESYTVEWNGYKVKINGTPYKLRQLPTRRVLGLAVEHTLPIPNASVLLVIGLYLPQLIVNGVNVRTGRPYQPLGKVPAWAYGAMILDLTLLLFGVIGAIFAVLGIFMTIRLAASSQMKSAAKIVLSFGYPVLVWLFLFLFYFVIGMGMAVANMG